MSWLRGMLKQLRAVVRRGDSERDLDDEFRFHLEMETAKYVAEGMSREAAAREALRRFGGVQRHKENVRSARWTSVLEDFVSDLRFALRCLWRQPGFAAAMIGTLALGIGASLTIFAALDAVLLRPLSFADPDRLVDVQRKLPSGASLLQVDGSVARGIVAESHFFVSVAVHAPLQMTLGGGSDPRMVRARAATPSLFATLGRYPALGRSFLPSDAQPGAEPTVVLSDETWTTLGRDPAIVGQQIELDRTRYRVIGVMPPDFRYPARYAADVFVPLDDTFRGGGVEHGRVSVLGRLAPEITPETASERLVGLVGGILGTPADSLGWRATAAPITQFRANRNVRAALWTVTGAVGLMLLVAVMDAMNLLLTRLTGRARELAVRHALGARRGRLVRHLLTESLVVAMVAGGMGTILANAGVGFLNRTAPAALTTLSAHRMVLDARVLVFGFGLTVLVGVSLGLAPALVAIRAARRSTATSITPYGARTRSKARVRSSLLVGQVALTVTLLAGAGLLAASFLQLLRVDPGYDTDGLIFLSVYPSERFYPTVESQRQFAEAVEERIHTLPGVTAVARAWVPTATGIAFGLALQAEEDAKPRDNQPDIVSVAEVRPDYLSTLRASLLSGRNFEPQDPPETAIIDPDLAHFLWGDVSPLGKRFRMDEGDPWLTVIGVVDLVLGPPDRSLGTMAVLRPRNEHHEVSSYSIRTDANIEVMLPLIRDAVRAVDAHQPIGSLMSAHEAIAEQVATQRFFLVVMAVLATAALALVAAGLYGVLSVGVSQRRRELGIRMALGARAASLQRMVLRHGLTLTAVGIVAGVGGAVIAGRVIRSLLFEVAPNDGRTLVIVAAAMLGVAASACFLPARRATRVDPAEVLRAE